MERTLYGEDHILLREAGRAGFLGPGVAIDGSKTFITNGY